MAKTLETKVYELLREYMNHEQAEYAAPRLIELYLKIKEEHGG